MARNTTAPAASPSAAPWVLKIDGEEMALRPDVDALTTIERTIGRPIYSIMTFGKEHGISIEMLAIIVPCLAGAAIHAAAGDKLPPVHEREGFSYEYSMMRLGAYSILDQSSPTKGMIVDAGILAVTAAVAQALGAASAGRVDRFGNLKPAK